MEISCHVNDKCHTKLLENIYFTKNHEVWFVRFNVKKSCICLKVARSHHASHLNSCMTSLHGDDIF